MRPWFVQRRVGNRREFVQLNHHWTGSCLACDPEWKGSTNGASEFSSRKEAEKAIRQHKSAIEVKAGRRVRLTVTQSAVW